MKICKDGRVWGQNNKEASGHLGILNGHKLRNKGIGIGKYIRTLIFRKIISEKVDNHGEKNPNWRGGISSQEQKFRNQVEYKLWRQAIFARDNWTCQECGRRGGGKLNAHHIKSFAEYSELRFAIDNGITLCYDCHKLTDNFCKR